MSYWNRKVIAMIVERISGSGAATVNINRHLPEEFRDKFKCTRQDAEVNVIRLDIENKTYELIKHPSPMDYHWMFSEALAIVARLDELRIYQGEDLTGDLFISGGFGWCDNVVISNPGWEFMWEKVIYLSDEDFKFVSDSKEG